MVDVINEPSEVAFCGIKIGVFVEPNFFFFDGAHEPFGEIVFLGVSDGGQPD